MIFYSKSHTPFRLPVSADNRHPRQQRSLLNSKLLRIWRLSTKDHVFSMQIHYLLSILHLKCVFTMWYQYFCRLEDDTKKKIHDKNVRFIFKKLNPESKYCVCATCSRGVPHAVVARVTNAALRASSQYLDLSDERTCLFTFSGNVMMQC